MSSNMCVAIRLVRQNRNSYVALVGALESTGVTDFVDVHLIDERDDLIMELEQLALRYKRVVFAWSLCTPQIEESRGLVEALRDRFGSELILVAGGPHPSGDSRGTLELGFDFVVVGEGEEIFPALVSRLNGEMQISNLKGVATRSNGMISFTPSERVVKLDDFPPFALLHGKFGPIEITRGCPWGCLYCQTTHLFGKNVRHRTIETICKYAEIALGRGYSDFRFVTPNCLAYGSRDGRTPDLGTVENLLRALREIVKDKGRIFFGTFPSEVRPDFVSEDALILIKTYTDNNNIIIGAQSGSDRVLEKCHRGHSVDDVRKATELTIKAGLKANIDFIFGLPGETRKDAYMTLDFAEELSKMGARIHGHTFMPLAGTPLEDAPPGKLEKNVRKTLKKMVSQGKLYGYWEKQETIARTIAALRDDE